MATRITTAATVEAITGMAVATAASMADSVDSMAAGIIEIAVF
jgi:hypothetical protein